ncbi:diguanylate cyclase [Stutzerimonas degradans]|uniref:diguanylate cyclase n=1 Tax=Stutzerimonas degradans TaxID=2968968 RepID=A0A8E2U4N9_9GAMM|nr:diguanylate cyclase [Stutzerimonas degradans]MCQ4274414.1 diguanylate cyclase [Stutzerimonas degradans]PNF77848.1 diguanylate cyclase AdrA [Stutzerimonas degradans]QPT23242.1 diguanylate cyclase [Stutzerimonas degradans]
MPDHPFTEATTRSSVSRRAFYPRFIGLGVGFFCVAAVFIERPATPVWTWALLIGFCYLWPFLAYWLSRRSPSPLRAERRQVLIDSLLGGFFIGAMQYNTLPSAVLLSMMAMNNCATGGAAFVLRGLLAQMAGMVLAGLLLGFGFAPRTSQMQIYACIPMLIVHPLVIGMVLYRLAMQLVRHKQALRELSRTDGLTGLFNRSYWDELFRLEFSHRQTRGGDAALALIDVDHFKNINDRYGHPLGDVVLRQVGACIARNLRVGDLSGRYGGDEFCVLLPGANGALAYEVMERLREDIARLDFDSAPQLSTSLSIGIAAFEPSMQDALEWIAAADRALYAAKHDGRNRISVAPSLGSHEAPLVAAL